MKDWTYNYQGRVEQPSVRACWCGGAGTTATQRGEIVLKLVNVHIPTAQSTARNAPRTGEFSLATFAG
jgi:hypothetical protein